MEESIVTVRGISKNFGDVQALNQVALDIRPGVFG